LANKDEYNKQLKTHKTDAAWHKAYYSG